MSNPKKLAGKVAAAPNKSLGFDADTKLNSNIATSFYIDKKGGQPQWLIRG